MGPSHPRSWTRGHAAARLLAFGVMINNAKSAYLHRIRHNGRRSQIRRPQSPIITVSCVYSLCMLFMHARLVLLVFVFDCYITLLITLQLASKLTREALGRTEIMPVVEH